MNYYIREKILTISFTFALIIGCGPSDGKLDAFKKPPTYLDSKVFVENGDTLMPARLEMFKDTLFVSYLGHHKIDVFTGNFVKSGSIFLVDPQPIFPTSFAVADSFIIASDHARKVVMIYGRDGSLKESFGYFPDGNTQLSPFDLTYYGGVLYLSDIGIGKILAISMADAAGITETGELVLDIPADDEMKLGFPACIYVTFEGRLFVGDAEESSVKVFTCDGQYIYDFDRVPAKNPFSPMGFAVDSKIDPSMQDVSSFDPSGIREMGRIHAVDPNNRSVHMFNPVGKYVSSYEPDEKMVKPSDIAIDSKSRKIYIADPRAKRIFIYEYEDI
ncbi:MAG: hypothetical protein JSW64_15095 [Candidatus Zixiibacteriota bacterium]|nr:MAG: hypothetical protein JSW64_15095 [candidate division Zixibacteria bacterium]